MLFSAEQIAARVDELGQLVAEDYADRVPVVVAILKGSALFVSDLIRAIDRPLEVEFLSVSSYGGATKSSGVVRIGKDVDRDLTGRDILIVEDIVDTGATLEHLHAYLGQWKPASIQSCALLARRDPDNQDKAQASYIGFEIDSEAFVIGYGLDHNQRYRNLPYIAEYLV